MGRKSKQEVTEHMAAKVPQALADRIHAYHRQLAEERPGERVTLTTVLLKTLAAGLAELGVKA